MFDYLLALWTWHFWIRILYPYSNIVQSELCIYSSSPSLIRQHLLQWKSVLTWDTDSLEEDRRILLPQNIWNLACFTCNTVANRKWTNTDLQTTTHKIRLRDTNLTTNNRGWIQVLRKGQKIRLRKFFFWSKSTALEH